MSPTKRTIANDNPSTGVMPDGGALADVSYVVAIASGKGGVGKSTTAVNIAYTLAEKGLAVGLLDADIFGPSIPRMTARIEPVSYQQQQGTSVIPPSIGGVKVISIAMFQTKDRPNVLRGPMAGAVIKQFLSQVQWGKLDYLIIDYPPGTSDIQLTLSQVVKISGAVLVTTPQEVAINDVEKAMALFKTTRIAILGVIETMSYFICDACQHRHHPLLSGGGEKLAKQAKVSLLAQIPQETTVALTSDRGIPITLQYKNSQASVEYRKAVDQIEIKLAEGKKALGSGFHLVWRR